MKLLSNMSPKHRQDAITSTKIFITALLVIGLVVGLSIIAASNIWIIYWIILPLISLVFLVGLWFAIYTTVSL